MIRVSKVGLFFAFVFLHVVEYVLHVVVVLKFFEEFFDLFALLRSHFLIVVRNALKFGTEDFKAVFFKILLDVGKGVKCAVNHDFFALVVELVHSVVNKLKLEFFEFDAFFGSDFKHTLVVEEERETAGSAE